MNPSTDRRGEVLALLGGVTCVAAFAGLYVLSDFGNTTGVFAASWLALGVLGIWIATYAELHQFRLVDEERFALAELDRERQEKLGGSRTIFDETDLDQMEALSMGRRLRSMERWFIPACGLFVAAYNLLIGLKLVGVSWFWPLLPFDVIREPAEIVASKMPIVAGFAAFIAFLAFLLSRWATVLARLQGFHLVRAGGNGMFGVVLAALASVLALLATNAFGLPKVDLWTAHAVGVLMVVLALESGLNFVLDFYRPRVPGIVARSFFDSRLLGMFTEPGGILKSLANAVDYQFGFKVSETWFYQLLGRWIVPLLVAQAAVIWLMTGVVVVPQGYKAVVEFSGVSGMWPSSVRVALPGVSLNAPWPATRATLIATDRVQRLEIGYDRVKEMASPPRPPHEPELWATKHRQSEYGLLVPDKRAAVAADATVPLNLLAMTIPIQWRVKPTAAQQYHRNAEDAAAIIEAQAYRVLTRFAGHADVLDLLGKGGAEAAEAIRRDLQDELDHAGLDDQDQTGADLGVEVVLVGLENVHPVTEAAAAYEDTVNAFQTKQSKILTAQGDARRTTVEAGGLKYQELYDAIVAEEVAEQGKSQLRRGAVRASIAAARRVDHLLRLEAGGMARRTVATAEQRAYGRVLAESSRAELFKIQLRAYNAAPEQYQMRRHLRTLETALAGLRKYVLALRDNRRVILILDENSAVPAGLIGSTIAGLKEANK